MKIAIITMSNGINYGNRLQNYAVQEVLKSLGCDVETIRNFTNQKNVDENSLKEKLKDLSAKINYMIPFTNIGKLKYILRERRFFDFNKKYIKQTKYSIDANNIPNDLNEKYDYFICGSDQIWNPEFDINSEIDFLTFADKEKRIAFSPSFGVTKIEDSKKENYKNMINGIKFLSVREEAGAEIIRELTNRKSTVLVDPTMLLSESDWIKIEKKPKLDIRKNYILTYFLGKKDKNLAMKIDEISKIYDLDIINLLDEENKYIYSLDPSEFIWLIHNCKLIYTDSFHGTVFSMIFEKPFVVCERKDNLKSMNSRLDTLLKKFNLNNRKIENLELKSIFDINYEEKDDILEFEKEKSINYLKEALNLK